MGVWRKWDFRIFFRGTGGKDKENREGVSDVFESQGAE
jgi:hypothetical protein